VGHSYSHDKNQGQTLHNSTADIEMDGLQAQVTLSPRTMNKIHGKSDDTIDKGKEDIDNDYEGEDQYCADRSDDEDTDDQETEDKQTDKEEADDLDGESEKEDSDYSDEEYHDDMY
jgi:hypothetical protein